MKKPKIRFKGFTDVWEQRKLEDIVERVTRKNQDLVSELPLTISAQYGLIDQGEFFDKRVASKDVSGYYLIYNGEFAYNKSTSNDAPWGAIKRLDRYKNGVLSTLYIIFRIKNEDIVSSDFIATYYDTSNWHMDIQAIATEGARNHGLLNIAPADFFKTELNIPQDIEEQQKIGDYFKSLNELITIHQRKCEETKILKKYMLQKMFPKNGLNIPQIRFDGFTNAWERRKLSECVRRKSETMLSDKKSPSVEYEDVNSEVGTLNKDITQKGTQKSGIAFDDKDVLYGKLRPYLHNWLNPDFKGVAVGDWWVLNPIDLNKNFLYVILQTPNYDNAANQSSGTKMPRADWNLVSNTEFYVPVSFEEQEKIANVFINLDHLITLHQRKCNELQNIKKFMLQNMFV